MKLDRTLRRLASLVVLSLALGASAGEALNIEPPTIVNLAPRQIERLKNGDVLRSMSTTMPFRGEATALIRAPMDQLAAILVDYPHAPDWAPSMAEMRVLRRDGDAEILAGVTDLPWPVPDRTWNMRAVVGYRTIAGRQAWVDVFQYVPGTGNINESAGYWVLSPLPDDPDWTYCRYVLYGDPGISLPDFLIRWASRSALPGIMNGLRKQHAKVYPAAAAPKP